MKRSAILIVSRGSNRRRMEDGPNAERYPKNTNIVNFFDMLRLSRHHCTNLCGSERARSMCQDESNRASDHLHHIYLTA